MEGGQLVNHKHGVYQKTWKPPGPSSKDQATEEHDSHSSCRSTHLLLV